MKRALCLLPLILSAANLPSCSTSAPCFTIANRQSTAGLAVSFTRVGKVYRASQQLKQGQEYQLTTDLQGRLMVVVHLPPSMSGKPETFQVVALLPPGTP